MSQAAAKFIVLEGMEGAGKSTNLSYICNFLQQQGVAHCVTREPGGTEVAEKIRQLLLAEHDEAIDPLAELLLIFAARAQHLRQVIEPALARGEWVISDRFTDATYAYQGEGRQIGVEKVELLECLVQAELRPDMTIILDVPVALSAERVHRRGNLDRFERESEAFFTRVREAYHRRAESAPARYQLIDASQPLPQVQGDLQAFLQCFVAPS